MSKESEQTKRSKENGARKQEVKNGALELDLNKDESMKQVNIYDDGNNGNSPTPKENISQVEILPLKIFPNHSQI